MNAPDRFELFLLQNGEDKLKETKISNMANTSDFLIQKEDHTFGFLVSEHLKERPHIRMAAYKVAHPNVPELFIRIQTDGEITPREAFMEVLKFLLRQYDQLFKEFVRECEIRRAVTAGDQDNAQGVI